MRIKIFFYFEKIKIMKFYFKGIFPGPDWIPGLFHIVLIIRGMNEVRKCPVFSAICIRLCSAPLSVHNVASSLPVQVL